METRANEFVKYPTINHITEDKDLIQKYKAQINHEMNNKEIISEIKRYCSNQIDIDNDDDEEEEKDNDDDDDDDDVNDDDEFIDFRGMRFELSQKKCNYQSFILNK